MEAAAQGRFRQIPLGKSMLGVAAVGACLGTALAWMEQRKQEEKLEAIRQMPDTLSPVLFPEAAPLPPVETAQAEPGLPAAMEGLPVYPGSLPQGFESAVIADGKPIEMARFFTEDSPEQLRAFYEQAFRRRGLHVLSHEFSPFAGYIGYMDWLQEELHLISYIRQGSQTMVFPSRSRPSERFEGAQLPAGVPVHPNVSLAKSIAFLEPEGGHRISYSATVAGESLESVRQFYKEALAASGWKAPKESQEGNRSTLEVATERMAANFSFEQTEEGVGIYLLLMGK